VSAICTSPDPEANGLWFNGIFREHEDRFSRFDPLGLMSAHFSMTTELESLPGIVHHVESFFHSLQFTYTKLEKVLQQFEDRGKERPISVYVMVLGRHTVLEDHRNPGEWYLDGVQDWGEHTIQRDLMNDTPYDDVTRDLDVHHKTVEQTHPPSLVFNHIIRIIKMLLEKDPQFFTRRRGCEMRIAC